MRLEASRIALQMLEKEKEKDNLKKALAYLDTQNNNRQPNPQREALLRQLTPDAGLGSIGGNEQPI